MSRASRVELPVGDSESQRHGTAAADAFPGGSGPVTSALPGDYAKRVYAGVLGKMIGVYLGRPIEGWTSARIHSTFGEVRDYVNGAVGRPLIVTDDDLSGTFAFVRAIEEHGPDLGSAEIGQTWLNQIVEGRTILWWGGMGNSTEETAYTRLKHGISAPASGSVALNGKMVAEQIGAQIFIDGWAMLAPGNPGLAARLARHAARVSHDGEAVDAAVAWVTMEALAFGPHSLIQLLDAAQRTLPVQGTLLQLYRDLRQWRQDLPDWRDAFSRLERQYGYHLYPGNAHVIPNHGVMLLALLYGNDSFEETLVICTSCGWDTDCNAGNVGALLGLRHGVEAIPARWRGPVADRLFVCSARGARVVTDAVQVTDDLVRLARRLNNLPPEPRPPRYHFGPPGSVQGFEGSRSAVLCGLGGSLGIQIQGRGRVTTAVFLPPDVPNTIDVPYARNLGAGWNYTLMATPALHPGQVVTAQVEAETSLMAGLTLDYYDAEDQLVRLDGQLQQLHLGTVTPLRWTVPDLGALPVARVGLNVVGTGQLRLAHLDWNGTPRLHHTRPAGPGQMWRRAWVNAAQRLDIKSPDLMRFTQRDGVGQQMLDAPDWTDFVLEARLTAHLPAPFGLAVHTRGLRRHYALWISPGKVELVRQSDDVRRVLAQVPLDWESGSPVHCYLQITGGRLVARVESSHLQAEDPEPLEAGGIAILAESNGVDLHCLTLQPVTPDHMNAERSRNTAVDR
ncbi:ADP-ribosylglycohydrolase family protein [Deinococcus frigens]|uniref:ADP-ribosylglycohydrolase family protein n=1 Tax=Deinococcus frigens TaxID=249403 RepID=UPI00068FA699|nr:ADP-ribosylglycohydrolase family protein [Deinococcus frigens]